MSASQTSREETRAEGWQWWAGPDEEQMLVGPCQSREEVIAEATRNEIGFYKNDDGSWGVSFYIVEARQDPIEIGDWLELDTPIETASERFMDSDIAAESDDEIFIATPEQEQDLVNRLKSACAEWQAAHGLVFKGWSFTATRNEERISKALPAEVSA